MKSANQSNNQAIPPILPRRGWVRGVGWSLLKMLFSSVGGGGAGAEGRKHANKPESFTIPKDSLSAWPVRTGPRQSSMLRLPCHAPCTRYSGTPQLSPLNRQCLWTREETHPRPLPLTLWLLPCSANKPPRTDSVRSQIRSKLRRQTKVWTQIYHQPH